MPFKPGQSGNPAGRPKGCSTIKTAATRCYEAIVKVLGSEATAGRVYELMEAWAKDAPLPDLLDMIERFAGPVMKELVKDNRIEVSTTDELAKAIQAALLAKAGNADRPEDN